MNIIIILHMFRSNISHDFILLYFILYTHHMPHKSSLHLNCYLLGNQVDYFWEKCYQGIHFQLWWEWCHNWKTVVQTLKLGALGCSMKIVKTTTKKNDSSSWLIIDLWMNSRLEEGILQDAILIIVYGFSYFNISLSLGHW